MDVVAGPDDEADCIRDEFTELSGDINILLYMCV